MSGRERADWAPWPASAGRASGRLRASPTWRVWSARADAVGLPGPTRTSADQLSASSDNAAPATSTTRGGPCALPGWELDRDGGDGARPVVVVPVDGGPGLDDPHEPGLVHHHRS